MSELKKEWYVVNTYVGQENRVKENLERRIKTMGLEDFLFQIVVAEEKEIEYKVLFTKYQHHATRLVHDLTSDSASHTIVVLGGDGTLNEVIDGIAYLDKVTLGYIPLGSNGYSRCPGADSCPNALHRHECRCT